MSSTSHVFLVINFVYWHWFADENEALNVGQDLLDKKYILPLQNGIKAAFMNDPKAYYRWDTYAVSMFLLV